MTLSNQPAKVPMIKVKIHCFKFQNILYWPEEEKRCIENIAIIIRKCNHAHLYLLYITYEIYMQKSSKRDNSTCTKTGVEEDCYLVIIGFNINFMHITIALPEKPVQDTRECEMEEISDSIYRETAPASYCQACINMAVCASRSCK